MNLGLEGTWIPFPPVSFSHLSLFHGMVHRYQGSTCLLPWMELALWFFPPFGSIRNRSGSPLQ